MIGMCGVAGSATLVPGMPRRIHTVEVVVSDEMVLPTDRVVEGVGPGIPPMSIQVVLGQGGLGASQFEQLLRGEESNLGREDLGLGYNHRRPGDIVVGNHRLRCEVVQKLSGSIEQCVRGDQLNVNSSYLTYGQRVIASSLDLAVDPRP